MNCEDFIRQLDELSLQHGASVPAQLQAHGDTCAQCQPVWADYQRLESAIRVWRGSVSSVNLMDRVLADLGPASTLARPSIRWQRALAALLGTAATLALGVWLTLPPAVGPVPVVEVTPPAPVEAGVDLTQSMASLWEEMRVPAPSLPEPALPRLPRVVSVWPSLTPGSDSPAQVSDGSRPTGLTNGDIAETAIPSSFPAAMRDRVTSAFSFLGQTLPGSPQG